MSASQRPPKPPKPPKEAQTKGSPKNAPKVSPKAGPKAAPKVPPKVGPKAAPKVPPKLGSKLAPKVTPKAAPKLGPKAAPKLGPKAAPKLGPKAGQKGPDLGTPKGRPDKFARGAGGPFPLEAPKKPRQTFREGLPHKPPKKPPQGSRKASPPGSPSGRHRGVQPESSTARPLAPPPAGAVHILGYHPVRAALTARPEDCLAFFVSESRRPTAQLADLVALARQNGIKPILVKREALEAMGSRHQGLALAAKAKREPSLSELFDLVPATEPALIVFLDHLEDPHNFGALIRSAAAFGALGVVYPKDRSAPLSPAVRLASAGGTEAIALVKVANLARAIGEAKKRGFWAVAAQAGSRTDALDFDYPERTALILGSEGDGMSHVLAANSDMSVGVALQSSLIDSLNVSNAGAILMHGYRASLARKNKQSP